MCQVDEEEYQQHLERAGRLSVSKKCVKCKELLAAVVVRPGDAYCRSCFKENFIHKFRAMLGKTRVIFPGEKVLLAVSGGPSSCSMLHQVQEGVSLNAHKKLRFLPGIVYIDEGGAVGLSKLERERATSEVREIFRSTGFPFYIVPLEQVLDLPSSVVATAPSLSEPSTGSYKAAVDHFLQAGSRKDLTTQRQEEMSLHDVSESQTRSLQQLMASAKSLTAREDLLSTLRQHLLVHTARTAAYSKLMLGDNCNRLAVKLLTSISLGRGAQLAQDTSFSDSRYGDIVSVRPMRDYSAKEIAFYNRLFNVPSVVVPSLETKFDHFNHSSSSLCPSQTPEKSSIQRLTESFITKLQADFPSTVSTIYRTSEKLQTADRSSSAAAEGGRCLLCMCSLDTVVEKASALQATLISEQLSHMKIQTPGPVEPKSALPAEQCCSSSGGEDCGRTGSGCCSSIREMEAADVRSLMCYSCQLTIKDMSTVQHLPQYILSEAWKRKRRSLMKEEIREFLLDADGD